MNTRTDVGLAHGSITLARPSIITGHSQPGEVAIDNDFAHSTRHARLLDFLLPNLSFPFLMVGIFLEPFTTLRLRGSVLWGDVFIGIAAVLLMVEAATRRVRLWLPWWLVAATMSLTLAFIIQSLSHMGNTNHEDLVYVLTIVFTCVLLPVVIVSQPLYRRSQVELLIGIWITGNLIGALIPVLQQRGFELLFLKDYLTSIAGRSAGLTNNPNNLGFFTAMTVPLVLALTLAQHRAWVYCAGLAASALLWYAIDLTGSRTALVTAALGSVLVLFLLMIRGHRSEITRRQMRIMVSLVLVAATFLAYRGGTHGALHRLLEPSESASIASEERAELFGQSFDAFWNYPIAGAGYRFTVKAHNVLVSSLECGGLLGASFLILIVLGFGSYVVRLLSQGMRGHAQFGIAVGMTAAYLVWLLVGFKEATLIYRSPLVGLGLLVLYCLYEQLPVGTHKTLDRRRSSDG